MSDQNFIDKQSAGLMRRSLATLIDMILVPLLTLFLIMVFGVVEDAEDYARGNNMLFNIFCVAVFSYLLLNGLLLWLRGQTVGKLVFRIHIMSVDSLGNHCRTSFWRLVFVRALFFPLLFLFVTPFLPRILFPDTGWLFLLPLLDQAFILGKDRRCIHDLLSGTYVITK
tara:strand:+ start:1776 stop:2282 length:507 start_codon:yes stop_codon:yes gene_type:complete